MFETQLKDKKTSIKVPEAYLPLLEDIRLLTADQTNPNKTTLKQQEQIWKSLQKYGWAYPIITNKDGVYADGEQRAEVCKQHGEFFAPVLRLPVSDVDRRMLRQILNKLKGKHKQELDEQEYIRIESVGEKLPEELDEQGGSFAIPETYEIIVECKDEADQKSIYEKLKLEGFKLRSSHLP
jgi:hypothetical protein